MFLSDEEISRRLEDEETRPVSVAQIIGEEGGILQLRGGQMKFEPKAFKHETPVSMTLVSQIDDVPKGCIPISPAVKCSTAKVKFSGLAEVRIPLYCNAQSNEVKVLWKKNFKSPYEELDAIPTCHNGVASFRVRHFCWYRAIWGSDKPVQMKLENYVLYCVPIASIHVLTCIRDESIQKQYLQALKDGGYKQAEPLPDSIEILDSEQMSYKMECKNPRYITMDPEPTVSFTGSSFSKRKKETRSFKLQNLPPTGIVDILYTLNRPNEEPKVSMLSLEWRDETKRESQAERNDMTGLGQRVEVIGSSMRTYLNHLSNEDVYRISQHKYALIINNGFRGTRLGSEVDTMKMITLWRAMGFNVTSKSDLRAREILGSCKEFADDAVDASVVTVVIMSHGGRTDDRREYFVGDDRQTVFLDDIIRIFSSHESQHLSDIPKIFLFQACRGGQIEHDFYEYDAEPQRQQYRPGRSDMIFAFPTQAGFRALRNTVDGSWLISAVSEVFAQHAHDKDVVQMLTRVNNKVSQRRTDGGVVEMSNYESYLRRDLFLFPGWPTR